MSVHASTGASRGKLFRRPSTAVSAPTSKRATSFHHSTRASTTGGDAGDYIVAVIEGKGSGVEVGVAAVDLNTAKTVITQVADSSAFTKTLQHLTLHQPITLLVPESSFGHNQSDRMNAGMAQLLEKLEGQFQVEAEPMARPYWNREDGLCFIRDLAIEDELKTSTLMTIADKYYALCATAALFRWIQTKQDMHFAKGSLHIRYAATSGTMFIDVETAKNLELATNSLSHKSVNTLYGLLNMCFTPMGARLLRTNILQPSNVRVIIENRLNVVQELSRDDATRKELRAALEPLGKMDIEKLLGQLSQQGQSQGSVPFTEQRITLLLQLKTVVRSAVSIKTLLTTSQADILRMIAGMLDDDRLESIERMINERLNEDSSLKNTSKGQAAKKMKLFAVKANFNKLLDVARETYRENQADITALLSTVNDDFEMDAQLEWSESGFRFVLSPDDLPDRVPRAVINVEITKNKVRFTTHELLKRNARMQQSEEEVFLLSDQIVGELLEEVRAFIGGLHQFSEAIALLDVLVSFAHVCAGRACVRPEFVGTMAIKAGRHPILDRNLAAGECIANDVYAADGTASFQIIQGPNMSGKSTYLRQIGLLTIQAMIGCFVPAEYASFKLHDAMLSRLSNDDSMEKSISTFAAEMATSAMILGMATPQSLILIDELGRGTAPQEGIGLSHSIAEALIRSKAFVFFATHFQDLSTTLSNLPGVVNSHLHVQDSPQTDGSKFGSRFCYKVVEGPCRSTHYGLELAKLAALPHEVMCRAADVAGQLTQLEEQGRNSSLTNAIASRRRTLLELRGKLSQIVQASKLSDIELARYLRRVQVDSMASLRRALKTEQDQQNSDNATYTEDHHSVSH